MSGPRRRGGACREVCRVARGHGGTGVGLQSPGDKCLGEGAVNTTRAVDVHGHLKSIFQE